MFLNIAICDDDKYFLDSFCQKIKSVLSDVKADIYFYLSGKELIDNISNMDVVFLDVDMPQMSGGETARQIRQLDSNKILVFVTNYDEFVYSSFEFQPFRFLRKRCIDAEINGVIKDILHKYNSSSRLLQFRTDSGEIFFNLNDIIYFDVLNHTLTLHSSDRNVTIKSTLAETEKQLADKGFVKIHKSFLVNCRYIYSVDKTTVSLLNYPDILPLSRHRRNETKKALLDYSRSYE